MNPLLEEAQARLDSGDFDGAERSCRKVLRRRPGDASAAYMLALLYLRRGEAGQAVELINRALTHALPRTHEVLENLGAALLAAGSPESAEMALREATAAGGSGPRLLMCLGIALAGQGRPAEARPVLQEAWRVAPDNADVGINLGNVEAALGNTEDALGCFRRVLGFDPRNATAWYNIGTLTRDAGRFEEALDAFDQVMSLVPGHADALNNLGTIHERLGRADEAIAAYRHGLASEPENVHLLTNLAGALRTLHLLRDAGNSCRRALDIRPDFVDAWVTLAGIEVDCGRFSGARECYQRVLQLAPGDYEAEFYYGMLGLALGDFTGAWQHYRARPSRRQLAGRVASLDDALPQDIQGKTVMIFGEQGIGDELFFLRWAPVLRNRGARLIGVCGKKIHVLLQRTGQFETLLAHGDPLPERNFSVAAGDLPMLLQEASGMPGPEMCPMPSLRFKPLNESLARMQTLLQRAGRPPYLAVTWRAGTRLTEQRNWRDQLLSKEMPLDVLGVALAGYPGTVISLQRNPEKHETQALAAELGAAVFDASEVNEDLEDMLALLDLIDDYVGVSNTNMHLRATLGRRARVFLPKTADWRWMATGSNSPWFPGFELYRRSSDGLWLDAVGQLRRDLGLVNGAGG